ncbi:SDR family NAD(P)-dependent oxidoreductase [Caulobacter sp. FWC2]|uniref:SDR family NAD(P)-dependent oxidoreductase n=1 Tax=Caulobacter sp. FWC2 TaxID=69664 RepID=UPI0018EE1BE0|nr:SDR family NAD(P)-dependent oxidoreductase [Caulobacter sp. FWC2]
MGLLDGKVALVTGGGGGIGRGIARRFIREGATVLVAEFNEDYCATIKAELTEELGGRAEVIKADVRVKDQIQGAVQKAVDLFGGLDILVNNAFTLSPKVLLEQKTDEMLDSTLHSGSGRGGGPCKPRGPTWPPAAAARSSTSIRSTWRQPPG